MKRNQRGFTNLALKYLRLVLTFLKVVDKVLDIWSRFVNYERLWQLRLQLR